MGVSRRRRSASGQSLELGGEDSITSECQVSVLVWPQINGYVHVIARALGDTVVIEENLVSCSSPPG